MRMQINRGNEEMKSLQTIEMWELVDLTPRRKLTRKNGCTK